MGKAEMAHVDNQSSPVSFGVYQPVTKNLTWPHTRRLTNPDLEFYVDNETNYKLCTTAYYV